MTADPWQTDRIDLEGYLHRLGVPAHTPSLAALNELHEAHVRSYTFDNIDVLLGQHRGTALDAINDKFVNRGRGGYCFEHGSLFAAALERLGYRVARHLGRVGSPTEKGRTHMVVRISVQDVTVLADPGFSLSLLRPIRLVDGAEDDYLGWPHHLRRIETPGGPMWELYRRREEEWILMHTHDDLPVHPVDIVIAHHFTSTHPESHFRHRLMATRHLADRHVSLSHETVTVRRAGAPTEHRRLRDREELNDWLDELGIPLTPEERSKLARWGSEGR
jgi:arylamine N-acetyltransferase